MQEIYIRNMLQTSYLSQATSELYKHQLSVIYLLKEAKNASDISNLTLEIKENRNSFIGHGGTGRQWFKDLKTREQGARLALMGLGLFQEEALLALPVMDVGYGLAVGIVFSGTIKKIRDEFDYTLKVRYKQDIWARNWQECKSKLSELDKEIDEISKRQKEDAKQLAECEKKCGKL